MSMENAIKFYSKVSKDKDLMDKFADLQGKNVDEKIFKEKVLPEAKKLGLEFTYQEALQVLNDEKKELDDAALENVSGGFEFSSSDGGFHFKLCEGLSFFTDTDEEKKDPPPPKDLI